MFWIFLKKLYIFGRKCTFGVEKNWAKNVVCEEKDKYHVGLGIIIWHGKWTSEGFWAVSFEKRLATRLLIHIIVVGQGAGGFRTKVKVENEYEKLKNTLSNYRCFLEDFFHINTKYKKKHHELYKKRMEEAEIKKLKNLAAMLSFKENLCNFCCGWKSK